MYFFNICNNSDILRIIHLLLKILDFVFLIIPMALIVMITIDLIKSIIVDEKSVKENNKKIITRIIFAITIFFVPTIVTVVMNTLTSIGINSEYKTCLSNAENIEKINAFDDVYDWLDHIDRIDNNSKQ